MNCVWLTLTLLCSSVQQRRHTNIFKTKQKLNLKQLTVQTFKLKPAEQKSVLRDQMKEGGGRWWSCLSDFEASSSMIDVSYFSWRCHSNRDWTTISRLLLLTPSSTSIEAMSRLLPSGRIIWSGEFSCYHQQEHFIRQKLLKLKMIMKSV